MPRSVAVRMRRPKPWEAEDRCRELVGGEGFVAVALELFGDGDKAGFIRDFKGEAADDEAG